MKSKTNSSVTEMQELNEEERNLIKEEAEFEKAIEIILMLKKNISLEEISKKTGKSISTIKTIERIINN